MAISGSTTYDAGGGVHTGVTGGYQGQDNGLLQYAINALNRRAAFEAQQRFAQYQPSQTAMAPGTGGQMIPTNPTPQFGGSAGDPSNDPQRRILNAQAAIAEAQSRAVPKKRVDIPGYGSYLVDDWDNVPAAMRPNTTFAATANPAAEDFSSLEDFATRRGRIDATNAMNAANTRAAGGGGDAFQHNFSNNYAAGGGGH